MKWGIFDRPETVHVAPIANDGYLLDGHVLEPTCECRPRPKREVGWIKTEWVHNDGH